MVIHRADSVFILEPENTPPTVSVRCSWGAAHTFFQVLNTRQAETLCPWLAEINDHIWFWRLPDANWSQGIFSSAVHFGGRASLCGQHIILSDSHLSNGSLSASHPNALSGVFIVTARASAICVLSISQLGHGGYDSAETLNVYMCAHFSTATYTDYCPGVEWMLHFPSALERYDWHLVFTTPLSDLESNIQQHHMMYFLLYLIIFILPTLYFKVKNKKLFTSLHWFNSY